MVKILAENDCKVTFNMFSAPVGYTRRSDPYAPQSLAETREVMARLLARLRHAMCFTLPTILWPIRTRGLHALYGCSYPRRNPSTDVGLGRSFRQYRTDLTWDRDAACCVPDTDCDDCRHYAAGSAVVTARLYRHAMDPDTWGSWLDYVDTYLAVWVMGYEKSPNLIAKPVPPPGVDLPVD